MMTSIMCTDYYCCRLDLQLARARTMIGGMKFSDAKICKKSTKKNHNIYIFFFKVTKICPIGH